MLVGDLGVVTDRETPEVPDVPNLPSTNGDAVVASRPSAHAVSCVLQTGLNRGSPVTRLQIGPEARIAFYLLDETTPVMRPMSRKLQFTVAACCTAAALLFSVAPSVMSSADTTLAARYSQRGRVARFYGRNSQRGVTTPLRTGRQGQWSRGTIPLGS
jgi:hypothetical protein